MLTRALDLPVCVEDGCEAVAIRADWCAKHAIACTGCWAFFGATHLTDGLCDDCKREDDDFERGGCHCGEEECGK